MSDRLNDAKRELRSAVTDFLTKPSKFNKARVLDLVDDYRPTWVSVKLDDDEGEPEQAEAGHDPVELQDAA